MSHCGLYSDDVMSLALCVDDEGYVEHLVGCEPADPDKALLQLARKTKSIDRSLFVYGASPDLEARREIIGEKGVYADEGKIGSYEASLRNVLDAIDRFAEDDLGRLTKGSMVVVPRAIFFETSSDRSRQKPCFEANIFGLDSRKRRDVMVVEEGLGYDRAINVIKRLGIRQVYVAWGEHSKQFADKVEAAGIGGRIHELNMASDEQVKRIILKSPKAATIAYGLALTGRGVVRGLEADRENRKRLEADLAMVR